MADAPRIEPLSRETREALISNKVRPDIPWARGLLLVRYEATVQAAEAERDQWAHEYDLCAADRDALARRAEALRAVVDRLASWDMLSTVRTSELVADGPYMRRMILAALAADDAARKAAS